MTKPSASGMIVSWRCWRIALADVVEVLDDPVPVDERLARLHGVRP